MTWQLVYLLAGAAVGVGMLLALRWALAHLAVWPEDTGRVIAGWRRTPGRRDLEEYRAEKLVVRVRCRLVADLVATSEGGEERILTSRPEDEAAEIYEAITGQPWTRVRLTERSVA